jgi:hypothetical protein
MTRFNSTDPIPTVAVPIAMFVAADALFAHLSRIDLAAAAPAPADGGQVVTAGGLITHGANDAISQGSAAGLALP